MIKINRRFEYQPLRRRKATESGYRVYETPAGPLPSVTTILKMTADTTALDEWRKRVGDKVAAIESREASALGSLMHDHLECHINGDPRPEGNNLVYQLARKMSDLIIQCGISRVSEVWGLEEGLYFPDLYAGTADLIGVHQRGDAIVDFKSAKKIKKAEWIDDYFLQGVAYSLAHNVIYGTRINTVAIFMASRELEFKEYIIEGQQFIRYSDEWQRRLEQFFSA